MKYDKPDIYERVTAEIVNAIETGAGVYRMPWHVTEADCFAPLNAASRKAYRGVNVVVLWAIAQARGYQSGFWATYSQWKDLGGQVRKGERAAPVVYWQITDNSGEHTDKVERDDEQKGGRLVLAKGYNVFNVAQVDGYQLPEKPVLSEAERIQHADEFFSTLGFHIRSRGGVACYDAEADIIYLPPLSCFRETSGYYSTLAHEVTHWSAAPHRLNRDLSGRFGSEGYAMEELVAELGAAFLCAGLKISTSPRKDHAAYLANWLTVLKRDKRAIFTAASQAQKAVDWMAEVAEKSQVRAA